MLCDLQWVTVFPSARQEDQKSVPRSLGIVGLCDSGHLVTISVLAMKQCLQDTDAIMTFTTTESAVRHVEMETE